MAAMASENPQDTFAALFEQQAPSAAPTRNKVRVGQRIEGIVLKVGTSTVFVELDGKREAMLDTMEVTGDDGEITVKVGDKIQAQVLEVDDQRGIVRLGKSGGRPDGAAGLLQAKQNGLAVEGKVTGVNKGGLDVEMGGVRAFCPSSQAGGRGEDPKALVGQTLRFLVTDVKDGGRNVVVSRRQLMEREARENQSALAATIEKGAKLNGKITSVREFGAFVDLGGIEGLIPKSEIAHERTMNVADVLKAGESVEVVVLDIKETDDPRTPRKITLSLKALIAAPEFPAEMKNKVTVGAVVTGKVEKIETFGLFVQLDGTQGRVGRGLIPNAETGLPRGADLRKSFPEGTPVTVKILETGDGRLRLSIKGAKDAEERAQFEDVRRTQQSTQSLGTLGDLLKKFNAKK
jgi:small subunit ribosomal protein S1